MIVQIKKKSVRRKIKKEWERGDKERVGEKRDRKSGRGEIKKE